MVLNRRNSLRNIEFSFKMFIDFDPNCKVFYHNFFFDENKMVLKIALTPSISDTNTSMNVATPKKKILNLKYEKFDITKYMYLTDII